MAKQVVLVELFYSGAWQTVVLYDRNGDEITFMRGDGDESAAPRSASITGTIDNRTNFYNPRNAASAIYGKVGLGTMVRVSVGALIRNVCALASMRPERTIDYSLALSRGDYSIPIEAAGKIRRIGRSSDPVHSPMYRASVRFTSAVGYWPGEDGKLSTQLTAVGPAAPGSQGTTTSPAGPALGAIEEYAVDAPISTEPLWRISPQPLQQVTAIFGPSGSTDGFQFGWVSKMPGGLPTAPNVISFGPGIFLDGPDDGWFWSVNTGATDYSIFTNGPFGFNQSWTAPHAGLSPDQWIRFVLKVTRVGTTGTWVLTWYDQYGNSSTANNTFTAADSTVGRLLSLRVLTSGFPIGAGPLYGHFIGLPGDSAEDLTSTEYKSAWQGWAGERAAARFLRMFGTEEGLGTTLVGTSSDTQLMGVQPVATLTEIMQEIRDTEDGLIFDERNNYGLIMRTRKTRYNQSAALALTWPTHFSPPLPEVVDYLDVHNRITIQQRDGGKYVTEDKTSVLGTAGNAGVEPKTVNVNVSSEFAQLAKLGAWYLKRWTVDGTRYPELTVDLVANPGLVAAASAVDVGDLITVDGLEPDQVRVYVVGITERVGGFTRTITFTCKPDQQFEPATYTGTKRYGSATSTLNAGVTSTAVTMVVTFTNVRDAWSTTAVPYAWNVAGERVTVTAMGAVTGTGPWTQSATVTRSVNGVVKAQLAAAPIQVHTSQLARYAL